MGSPRQIKTIKPIQVALNVRIDETLYDDLVREVATQGRTKRDFIEQSIREYIDRCRAKT